MLSFTGSPNKTSNSGNSRKRRLDMGSSFSGKSADNESWNDIHVALLKDLEKRGTLWRYGTKHLKLWTDEIMSGNSAGINEEPVWEKHIDAVSVPPKMKKSPTVKIDSPSSTNHLLQMMFMQQQQRSEMMQTALLACLSNNSAKFQVCLTMNLLQCVSQGQSFCSLQALRVTWKNLRQPVLKYLPAIFTIYSDVNYCLKGAGKDY